MEQQNQNQIFETLSPTRLFFRCALPSMVSMAVAALYTIADGVFVGRFIGSDALAAINLVMPLLSISFALADMVAVGSSVQTTITRPDMPDKIRMDFSTPAPMSRITLSYAPDKSARSSARICKRPTGIEASPAEPERPAMTSKRHLSQ